MKSIIFAFVSAISAGVVVYSYSLVPPIFSALLTFTSVFLALSCVRISTVELLKVFKE